MRIVMWTRKNASECISTERLLTRDTLRAIETAIVSLVKNLANRGKRVGLLEMKISVIFLDGYWPREMSPSDRG